MDLIKSETPQDLSREYGKAWNVGSGDASKQEEITLNNFCKCVLLNVSHVPLPINSCNSLTKGLRFHVDPTYELFVLVSGILPGRFVHYIMSKYISPTIFFYLLYITSTTLDP